VGADREIELLYREHGDRMWRALLAFTGNPDVASDAVAEAFAQALRRGDALRDPRAWIWRTAFVIAKGDMRERRRALPLVGEALGSYEMEEPSLALMSALQELGEKICMRQPGWARGSILCRAATAKRWWTSSQVGGRP